MTYAEAQEAYAAYLNAAPRAREHYDAEALEEFLEDMERARVARDAAWLELIPTIGDA